MNKSLELEIPIIATNEVFYLNKDMHEAHDALICIGNKTYVNEKSRIKLSNQHYFKDNSENSKIIQELLLIEKRISEYLKDNNIAKVKLEK